MSITNNVARAKTDYDEVYEAGRKSQYDEFWDNYQQNGNRTEYNYAFGNYLWTLETFKPKYNITPRNANYMFQYNALGGDLVAILDNLGISLDLSKAVYATNIFAGSKFTRIGVVDLSQLLTLTSGFTNASSLETIDKLKVREALKYSAPFSGCINLQNLTIEGTIGQNGLNLSWSKKLNKASITSIINCLSTTTSGLSVTLSLTAVKTAFNTTDPETCTEWKALEATKSNWTITLSDS